MVWGTGQTAECVSLSEVGAGRPVLNVWPDYRVQPPSQSLVFMVACLSIALGDDQLGFEAPRSPKWMGCGCSGGWLQWRLWWIYWWGDRGHYLNVTATWGVPPTVPAHFISQTHPYLFLASQACLVGELGWDIARGRYLFSQEGKIRVKYEGGSGILASLTDCYLLIKFWFGLFPVPGLCSSSYRSCRLW